MSASPPIRDVRFDLERGHGGVWNPARPEFSHLFNASSRARRAAYVGGWRLRCVEG
jgi:hypothetical protein